MRSRYDVCPVFASEQFPLYIGPSHHNNPHLLCKQVAHPGSVTPGSRDNHPSHSSRLPGHTHATLKASPYTQSVHSRKQETLIPHTNALLLLLPRSAHIAPPRPLTQALLQNDAAPLQVKTTAGSVTGSIPSIFSSARFGRYVVTRFLADANLHGHRPTVTIKPPDSLTPA